MSNMSVLTPAINSATTKQSKTPSSGLRRLLFISPLLVNLLLTGCGPSSTSEKQEERVEYFNKYDKAITSYNNGEADFELYNFGPNLSTLKKFVIFLDKNYKLDSSVFSWLQMTDKQKTDLGLPSSDNATIQALLSLTPEERIVLGVEKDYQEFLAILKRTKI